MNEKFEFKIETEDSDLLEFDYSFGKEELDKRLEENQLEIDVLSKKIDLNTNHSDSTDWTIAIGSGILAGIIDSVYVGDLSFENAQEFGSEKVNGFVLKIAEKFGYNGDSLEGGVRFLEQKFPIPADSATNIFGGGLQHHLRDFSHHPTPIGLVFSLLTQFTGKVYGTDVTGRFIIEDLQCSDFIGKDFHTKLSIGVFNWIFHMVSDIAGSSGSIAMGKRGTGLPGPLLSLLKEISSLPFFSHEENNNSFCLWVSKLFNGTLLSERDINGKLIPEKVVKFDLRTEIGMLNEFGKQAVPVIINECFVRLFYFVRRLIREFKSKDISGFRDFFGKIDWDNTLPVKNRTITRMMTIATGTFVTVDFVDAAIRSGINSGGDWVNFAKNMLLKINFVGVGRFVVSFGNDIYMGGKCEKSRNERLYRMSEQIFLKSAKLYYKQNEMWVEAKKTEDAIKEMECVARTYFENSKKIEDTTDSFGKTVATSRGGIKENNPGLLEDLQSIL
jgi:hypothetical protein